MGSALAQPDPAFEVASIKPNVAGQDSFSWDVAADGRLTARNMSLWNLIRYAFNLRDLQIEGGPGWLKSQGFDIQAVPASPVSREQAVAMLRTLLRDRFQLKSHLETRNQPSYALVVSKDGHRLTPAREDGPNRMMIGQLSARKMTLKALAQILEFDLDRPVADRTGLSGEFAIDLEWTPEKQRTAANATDSGPARPSIFQALPEQLGLRLESTTAPIEVTVVDSVATPSEN